PACAQRWSLKCFQALEFFAWQLAEPPRARLVDANADLGIELGQLRRHVQLDAGNADRWRRISGRRRCVDPNRHLVLSPSLHIEHNAGGTKDTRPDCRTITFAQSIARTMLPSLKARGAL